MSKDLKRRRSLDDYSPDVLPPTKKRKGSETLTDIVEKVLESKWKSKPQIVEEINIMVEKGKCYAYKNLGASISSILSDLVKRKKVKKKGKRRNFMFKMISPIIGGEEDSYEETVSVPPPKVSVKATKGKRKKWKYDDDADFVDYNYSYNDEQEYEDDDDEKEVEVTSRKPTNTKQSKSSSNAYINLETDFNEETPLWTVVLSILKQDMCQMSSRDIIEKIQLQVKAKKLPQYKHLRKDVSSRLSQLVKKGLVQRTGKRGKFKFKYAVEENEPNSSQDSPNETTTTQIKKPKAKRKITKKLNTSANSKRGNTRRNGSFLGNERNSGGSPNRGSRASRISPNKNTNNAFIGNERDGTIGSDGTTDLFYQRETLDVNSLLGENEMQQGTRIKSRGRGRGGSRFERDYSSEDHLDGGIDEFADFDEDNGLFEVPKNSWKPKKEKKLFISTTNTRKQYQKPGKRGGSSTGGTNSSGKKHLTTYILKVLRGNKEKRMNNAEIVVEVEKMIPESIHRLSSVVSSQLSDLVKKKEVLRFGERRHYLYQIAKLSEDEESENVTENERYDFSEDEENEIDNSGSRRRKEKNTNQRLYRHQRQQRNLLPNRYQHPNSVNNQFFLKTPNLFNIKGSKEFENFPQLFTKKPIYDVVDDIVDENRHYGIHNPVGMEYFLKFANAKFNVQEKLDEDLSTYRDEITDIVNATEMFSNDWGFDKLPKYDDDPDSVLESLFDGL